MSSVGVTEERFFYFDEARSNLQQVSTTVDQTIKALKKRDDEGDAVAKILLYLYRGLFLIIEGEKKYRTGDYTGAATEFSEGGKMINRFQRMSSGFSVEYQHEAERLDLFTKGRHSESLALKKGTKLDAQLAQLMEADNSYTLEAQIAAQMKKPLLIYNSKARASFVQGLAYKLEGQNALVEQDLRQAKKMHLSAYRSFLFATYFNPSYNVWVAEQNKEIKTVLKMVLEERAAEEWEDAYTLSSEGQFLRSSEKCHSSSKLYERASKLATDQREAKLLLAFSFMLKGSMYEAKANEFLKNQNDAKSAAIQFQLATEAMENATTNYPVGESQNDLKRWQAQQQYYSGLHFQSQGIANLDQEKYEEAIKFFEQAHEEFKNSIKIAEESQDKVLVKLINKSIAEAIGYIKMCKTVLD